jgi:hypothetical protein
VPPDYLGHNRHADSGTAKYKISGDEGNNSGAFSERIVYLPHSYQANDMPFGLILCVKHSAMDLNAADNDRTCKHALPTAQAIEKQRLHSAAAIAAQYMSKDKATSSSEIDMTHGRSSEESAAESKEYISWICSFNANKKFDPISFQSWMNIMRRVSK